MNFKNARVSMTIAVRKAAVCVHRARSRGHVLRLAALAGVWSCGRAAGPSEPAQAQVATYTLVSIDGDSLPAASSKADPRTVYFAGVLFLYGADSAVTRIGLTSPPPPGLPEFDVYQVGAYSVAIRGSQIVLTPNTFGDPPDTGTFSPTEIILRCPDISDGSGAMQLFRFVVK